MASTLKDVPGSGNGPGTQGAAAGDEATGGGDGADQRGGRGAAVSVRTATSGRVRRRAGRWVSPTPREV